MSIKNVNSTIHTTEWDDVSIAPSDNRVGCKQCTADFVRRSGPVLVECNDCLSTPGGNDCICPQPRDYGLDNNEGIATQDWQMHEYRNALLRFEDAPVPMDDIWVQSTSDGRWSLWLRSSTTVLDLVQYLKRYFNADVWKKIAGYWTDLYYFACRLPRDLKKQMGRKFMEECLDWVRLQDTTPRLAYEAPMRGYCMRCGEPAINNRTHTPLAKRLIKSNKQLWLKRYLGRYRTIKYGLGVMGICHRCLVHGYNCLMFNKRITVPYNMQAEPVIKFDVDAEFHP